MVLKQGTVLILGFLAAVAAAFIPYFLSYVSLPFAVIILLLIVLVTVSLSTSLGCSLRSTSSLSVNSSQ